MAQSGAGCEFKTVSETLSGAIAMHIEKFSKKAPRSESEKTLSKLKGRQDPKSAVKTRKSIPGTLLVSTLSGIGLLIPYDKEKDLGYREYGLSDKELKILLNGVEHETSTGELGKKRTEWDELNSCVAFANDEALPTYPVIPFLPSILTLLFVTV